MNAATDSDSAGGTNDNKPGSSSASGGTSVPTGPIVGGVIGGLALLALAGFAIWFFCLRKRKPASDAAPPSHVADGIHSYHSSPPPLYDPHQQEKSPQELPQEREAAMVATHERPVELDNGQWQQQGWQQQQPGYRNLHEMA